MSGAVIGMIAAGVAAPVIMGVLLRSRLFRFDPASLLDEDRERILRSYRKHEVVVILTILGSLVVFTYLFFKGFSSIQRVILPSSDGVRFALSMHPIVWFLPSLFVAFLASGVAVDIGLRLWLRDRYPEYRIYDGLRYGIDSRRVIMLLLSLLLPFFIYFAVLIPQCYYYFSDGGIRLSPFFSTSSKEYSYRDIERIIEERSFKAPSGKIVRRSRYTIDFSDGYRWSSHRTITTLPEGDEEQFVAYISERSGIPIDIVDPHRKPENQKVYDQGSGNLPPG